MNLDKRIDEILRTARFKGGYWDDAKAHEMEDKLLRELINEYLPEKIKVKLKRLFDADFTRYYE